MSQNILVTYDAAVDAAYIALAEIPAGGVSSMVFGVQVPECPRESNLDFDSLGVLLGIEILGASLALPAELIAGAQKISSR